MHGNVWEWVQDNLHNNYVDAPDDGSSWEIGDDSNHVLRGGAWYDNAFDCQSAKRGFDDSAHRYISFGFRLVRI